MHLRRNDKKTNLHLWADELPNLAIEGVWEADNALQVMTFDRH